MTEKREVPRGTRCGCKARHDEPNPTAHDVGGCPNEAEGFALVMVPVMDFVPGRGWTPAGSQVREVAMCGPCLRENERWWNRWWKR